MNIYFSSVKDIEKLQWLVEHGARNFLLSFEDSKIIKQIEFLSNYKAQGIDINLLIDSGAYSVWNSGKTIDIDEYIKFIDKAKTITKQQTYFVNLDVIPHIKGTVPTQEQIVTAAKKGMENYHYIKSKGHITMNVYHQFEGLELLREIIRDTNDLNYIGIAPAKDKSFEEKCAFLAEVLSEIKDSVKTHLLGITAKEILEMFPSFSADSSSWVNVSRFGECFNYKKLEKNPKKGMSEESLFYYDEEGTCKNAFKYYIHLQEYITKLWNYKGVNWS